MISTITGKMVRRMNTSETSALGAAMLAACGCGFFSSVWHSCSALHPIASDFFQPQSHQSSHYSAIFEQAYRPLYPTLRETMKCLDNHGSENSPD
jgi:sugar (pentulose or hexulose) kinase